MGTLSGNYYGGIVKDGLILMVDSAKKDSYDRLGVNWRDVSGRGNNGTLVNFGGQFWDSNYGGSILFDGIDSYVDFSDIPFRITNYSFTCEFVFYFNGNNYTNKPLIGKRNSASPFNSWTVGVNNGDPYAGGTGKVLMAFLRDDNNPNINTSNDRVLTYTLPSAGIYHVVLTNNQSQAQLWVNGTLRSTNTTNLVSGNFNITGYNFRIGNYYTANYWDEKIYLTRFYNKTLSSSEISQNYNATKVRYFTPFEYFVVAGGGSAGSNGGGGGGAGGLLVGSIFIQPNTTLTVTVGSGGVYPAVGNNSSLTGTSFSIIATGGGRGTSRDGNLGTTGGSGAGGAGWTQGNSSESGFAGISGQGSSGGNGTNYSLGGSSAGGGGGGYSSSGTNGSSQQGGNGGNGYLLPWNGIGYAGGGAGSGLDYSNFFGRAGTVQAGYGGGGPQNSSANGRVNSGGGGGSLANATNSGWSGGGSGGSGIVILRVGGNLRTTTGNPTITDNGNHFQYVFSGTGTITI